MQQVLQGLVDQANEQHTNAVRLTGNGLQAGAFTAAVQAAGLVDTLNGKGPFTVFAPNNAAFAKIPADTLNAILADKAKLTSILTYHVVAGKVMAADVKDGEVATLLGPKVTLKKDAGGVTVNGAKVVLPDLAGTNGVVHVIDSVLLPPK